MSKQFFIRVLTACFLYFAVVVPLRCAPGQNQLLGILQSDAPAPEKWAAARQLAGIAGADVVPALAVLLTNARTSDLARYVLEPMPYPAVDKALRNALTGASGQCLAGIIATIGARRDAGDVGRLGRYLDSEDPVVVQTTLTALAKIGTSSAAKEIEARTARASAKTRTKFLAAVIQCADTLRADGKRREAFAVFQWVLSKDIPPWIHRAAVQGVIVTGGSESSKLLGKYLQSDPDTVIGLVQRELPGEGFSDVLIAGLPKLPEEKQILLLQALSQRSDSTAAAELLRVTWTGKSALRLAAIRGARHSADLVAVLADLVGDEDTNVAKAACDRLISLPEREADSAILVLLDSKTPPVRVAAARMAGHRRLAAATPLLIRAAASAQTNLADAALTALSETANESDAGAVAGLFSCPGIDEESVESLLTAMGGRAKNPEAFVNKMAAAYLRAAPKEKAALGRVLKSMGAPMPAAPLAKVEEYPFFPFCIDWHDAKKRNYAQQAAMLKELGYEGVGHIYLDGVAARLKSLDDAGLRLFQITMTVDLTPGKAPYDPRFKEVLALVKGRQVQFDLLFNGAKPADPSVEQRAVKLLQDMSDLAKDSGAQLLLYPHVGCWVQSINDAVRVADEIDRPNVGVMFNLCHWLRVDKQRDYKPLLERAMPRLWAVSVSGADDFDPNPGWSHYIQPLDKGSFNVGLFLKTLKELGYKGPIGLQCYGIGGDAREHLARSIAAWQKLRLNLEAPTPPPG